jgi:hypothetical protein
MNPNGNASAKAFGSPALPASHMNYAWDETWRRLLSWTSGQGHAERLAAQVLYAEGYENVDPSHPLGGPDGGKDALARKDGRIWAMAAYFPRDQHDFAEIKAKFLADVAKAGPTRADGVMFVTNQELRLAQRRALHEATSVPIDLIHLERLTAILDCPSMHPVRSQFLGISTETGSSAPAQPSWHDFVARAPHCPGSPDNWSLHDGMLLTRMLALPAPPTRHPDAAAPVAMFENAAQAAMRAAAHWPNAVSLLARRLGEGWTPDGSHRWVAGRMTSNVENLARGGYAAVAFDTRTGALAVERTWPTAIGEDDEPLSYRAAREPEVVAELIVALRLAGSLLAGCGTPVDVAWYFGAVGGEQNHLVSSQCAVGPRFGHPVPLQQPVAEVPTHHLDSTRFEIEDLVDPYRSAQVLAGPWLATFRDDDLLTALRTCFTKRGGNAGRSGRRRGA